MVHTDLSAADLLGIAEAKARKLRPRERCLVIAHLEEIGEIRSNSELAALFGVKESTIQSDKAQILTNVADSLTPDQAMAFVAEHIRQYRLLQSISLRGLAENLKGTEGERRYIEAYLKVLKDEQSLLKDIGLIRPELAKQNTSEEHWVATVEIKSGECGVRQATPEEAAAETEKAST